MALNIGISLASIVQYLYTAVGRELLSRSEILFAIEDHVASVAETIVARTGTRTISDLTRILSEMENDLTGMAGYRSLTLSGKRQVVHGKFSDRDPAILWRAVKEYVPSRLG
jgi:predicted tellurium resistance membrane protein TerC